jgi:hypothetical protein
MRTWVLTVGLAVTFSTALLAQEPVTSQTPLQSVLRWIPDPPDQPDHPGAEGKNPHGEEHGDNHGEGHHHEEPGDLLLSNFLTSGWSEPFEERERAGRAPRFNLFKSRQGFLERIGFVNYAYTNGLDNGKFDEHELAAGLEWAFNRRFQLGFESLYTWQQPRTEEGRRGDGLRWDFSTRLQLIDTADHAYNFQVHVVTPQSRLDFPQTEMAFTLAGFEDLTNTLGLSRVGLYHDIEYATLFGPRGEGEDRRPANLLRYDVSIAKTLVDSKTPLLADFTVFLETYGVTSLDGAHSGRTELSLTPGFRFNPTGRQEKAWWVQVGLECPVTGPRPFNERVLLAIIHDF